MFYKNIFYLKIYDKETHSNISNGISFCSRTGLKPKELLNLFFYRSIGLHFPPSFRTNPTTVALSLLVSVNFEFG